MHSVTVTIPGTPVAKGRPRIGLGKAYTPGKTAAAEVALGWEFREVCREPLDGPLNLAVSFYFEPPRRWRKARREAIEAGHVEHHTGRPDLDNLLKLVLDAGNCILWHDDAQVSTIVASKSVAKQARTSITVRPALPD